MQFLKKPDKARPARVAIPIMGLVPQGLGTGFHTGICIPMFITALFTVDKRRKQPECPWTDERVNKTWSVYTMESESALDRKETDPPSSMDEPHRLRARPNRLVRKGPTTGDCPYTGHPEDSKPQGGKWRWRA